MQKLCSLLGILVLLVLLQNLILSTEQFKNNSMFLLLSLLILMMIVTVVVVITLCSLTVPQTSLLQAYSLLIEVLFSTVLVFIAFPYFLQKTN
jgi:putative effector of murein hydrolase LrgA (UPF0299 family)